MAVDSKYVDLADRDIIVRNAVQALAAIAVAVFGGILTRLAWDAFVSVAGTQLIQNGAVLNGIQTAVVYAGLGLGGASYLYARREWDLLHLRRPTLRDGGWILVGVVLVFFANVGASAVLTFVATVLNELFGMTVEAGQNRIILAGRKNPLLFVVLIPVTLLFVGPVEEFLFRGIVQGLFKRALGTLPGIVAAGLFFGLAHYAAIASGNPLTYIFAAGVLGIVLGALYEYTETLLVPAAVHGLWNAALFAGQYYVATHPNVVPG